MCSPHQVLAGPPPPPYGFPLYYSPRSHFYPEANREGVGGQWKRVKRADEVFSTIIQEIPQVTPRNVLTRSVLLINLYFILFSGRGGKPPSNE